MNYPKLLSNKIKPPNTIISYNTIIKLDNKLEDDIFGTKCVINTYFKTVYHRKHKISLTRLLYNNYIAPLKKNEFILHTCKNKNCITLKHLCKRTYTNRFKPEIKIITPFSPSMLIITFD